jgi:hypothetical protein
LLLNGCTFLREPPSELGRKVTLTLAEPEPEISGELLAVADERVWIRTKAGVRDVPLSSIQKARVRRHGLDARAAAKWVAAGAVVTSLALASACARVDGNDGCERLGVVVGGTWLVIGGFSAASLAKSSRLDVTPPVSEPLRPFARFPQGLPAGVEPSELARLPAKQTSDREK